MKQRAPRNKTLSCTESEMQDFSKNLINLSDPAELSLIIDRIINDNIDNVSPMLPKRFADLLIMDPPYNITKNYNDIIFRSKTTQDYVDWFDEKIKSMLPLLKPNATIYVCSDWNTSNIIFPIIDKYFIVRNRITWEREKGRGARSNWKNNTEDIWFCTMGDDYVFNVDSVKLKRRVLAPYRSDDGSPKDWVESDGGNFRLTHPSNLWSDITIPFWSMPENTDHPTQKPEKLIAKLVLASSNPGDIVLDPFLGSGTTAVVARKLDRRFCGIEQNQEYCCWAEKRLLQAKNNPGIQGYSDGVFWERNSLNDQKNAISKNTTLDLFNV